ncbi:phage Gp37/Gp68 family protein [Zoogloea sp.]|uniref:DUF5131 family protein n=1 Tax=Zoogloea sp. TaxID=49181 RepID=UPI001AC54EB9|nr:phage Gp37/Gp68 family protein [Zoogloea sp.]MBN8283433.1 phage Gp37/Gp68 family protein [Zoogloea sp.]
MADKSKIEWTDATWNPVTGCAKVSQGCKHCYAEREWPRMTKLVPAYAGRDFTDVRTHGDRLDQPIRWAKRRMIFVNSMSDLFHPAVSDDFIDCVVGVMWACLYGRNEQPGHVFQVLTKRADRMRAYFNSDRREAWARAAVNYGGGIDPDSLWDQIMDFDGPHPRIWLGVSVEDQAAANERIPLLLDTPAAVRWISAEPLLGSVDIFSTMTGELLHTSGNEFDPGWLNWIVVGGESGPKARPMHPAWARSLRDQCATAGVPMLFKQWGEWVPRSDCYHTFDDGKSLADIDPGATRWPCIRLNENGGDGNRLEDEDGGDSAYMQRVGKKLAGRLLDGVQHDGYPFDHSGSRIRNPESASPETSENLL